MSNQLKQKFLNSKVHHIQFSPSSNHLSLLRYLRSQGIIHGIQSNTIRLNPMIHFKVINSSKFSLKKESHLSWLNKYKSNDLFIVKHHHKLSKLQKHVGGQLLHRIKFQ